MRAPQKFGYGGLLLIRLIPLSFYDQLKYSFDSMTAYLYTGDLYSDSHHCILITLLYTYVYRLPVTCDTLPPTLCTLAKLVTP